MKNSREENEFIRHYLHSKQGISFVTLTHKTVMKKMSQSFFFVVAPKISDFANQFLTRFYSVVQPFWGGLPTLIPTFLPISGIWQGRGQLF